MLSVNNVMFSYIMEKVKGIKRGVVRQKLTTFRLDNDNALWLDSQPNKGRYINELIREDRRKNSV